ncbi:MAG: glycosyltransferase [candidate division WOR-3 bacterium]|jgi:glycosyltransferase involved in cell wall biosynthesis|nr:glycosyltransferase [candidate division WOR-3 bacterium]MCR4423936.1 glycosyltransferase [candidate division WOR-3 bacterium]MDH7519274.1 glycosyltransferase [bacterium]
MNRVLFIAYYTPPLGLSGVMRVTKLAKFLPEFGWEVLLLTVKDVAYYAYDPELVADLRRAKVFRTESLDPNRLLRVLGVRQIKGGSGETGQTLKGTIEGAPAFFRRFFFPDSKVGWLPFAVRTGKKVIARFNPQVIFASAPPWTALMVGEKLSRLSGLPFVADFRDPWPGGFEEPPLGQKKRLLRLRERILQQAKLVLAVNQGTARLVGEMVEVLENGFDPEEFNVEPEQLEGFSILYAGNLWHQEKVLSDVVQALVEIPDARLYIAGGVSEEIGRRFRTNPQVRFFGVVSHQRTMSLMKGAQVLLYLGKPGQPVGLKLYEYLGSGKPIVVWADEDSEPAQIVREAGQGFICQDRQGFVAVLKEIREKGVGTPVVRALGDVPLQGEVDRYNRRFQAKRLADYFGRLLDGRIAARPDRRQ